MDLDDEQAAAHLRRGPGQGRIVEHGPARVAITVTRNVDSSKFVQTISLSAGDAGDRVEFGNAIDWRHGGEAQGHLPAHRVEQARHL